MPKIPMWAWLIIGLVIVWQMGGLKGFNMPSLGGGSSGGFSSNSGGGYQSNPGYSHSGH